MGREKILDDSLGLNVSLPLTRAVYEIYSAAAELPPSHTELAYKVKEEELAIRSLLKEYEQIPREPKPGPEAWMESAKCNGTGVDLFFPTVGTSVDPPKKVCIQCPVREECLEYALINRIDNGVWGGESERERRRILRQRRDTSKSSNKV